MLLQEGASMTELRRQQIVEEIKKQKYTRVSELAGKFDVSQVTIRKDLTALEKQGILVRYHGKVALAELPSVSYLERSEKNMDKKALIASAAASMIKDGDSIALDAGSTVNCIAEVLSGLSGHNIITNSITAAATLEHSANTVTVVGGQLVGQSHCTVGPDAEEYLSGIKTNIAFIGCSGVRGDTGICTGLRLEGGVKQALMHSAEKVVAVFDDSKFSSGSMYMFGDFSEFDTVITTTPGTDLEALDRLKRLGVEVIFADTL